MCSQFSIYTRPPKTPLIFRDKNLHSFLDTSEKRRNSPLFWRDLNDIWLERSHKQSSSTTQLRNRPPELKNCQLEFSRHLSSYLAFSAWDDWACGSSSGQQCRARWKTARGPPAFIVTADRLLIGRIFRRKQRSNPTAQRGSWQPSLETRVAVTMMIAPEEGIMASHGKSVSVWVQTSSLIDVS